MSPLGGFRLAPRVVQWLVSLACVIAGAALLAAQASGADLAERMRGSTLKIDDARLRSALQQPEDWVTTGMDYAETHYSPLNQITTENVSQLGLAWSVELGTRRGIEATPIVVDGILYFTGPWSVVFAYDARTGKEIWQWDPRVDKAVYGQRSCCDVVNRGVAVYKGRVYVGVLDGRLVALEASSGRVAWETRTVDSGKSYTITGAPRVVEGKVLIGNGGAEYGVRGYVSAYDAETGRLAWRTYTVPGNPADGFESKALEAAAKTWKGTWWTAGGGGTCWDAMAYDPELKLVYVGTGNGSPWNRRHRSPGGGDNLYLSCILALRPETGEVVWHFQTTPGDTWDFTATQPIVLADLKLDGRVRKVLMQAPKNGFFYVIDRESGAFLSGTNFVDVTWAEGLDPKTGRPIERAGADYAKAGFLVKPGSFGAHSWQSMAYHPKSGLVYIPAMGFQETFEDDPHWKYDPALWNVGLIFKGETTNSKPGMLLAWDPVKQRAAWEVSYPSMWNGGVLATGGDLVFQGTGDGRFVAYDARDGRRLWQTPTGTAIIAAPVSYRIDGRQYITVLAGWGGAYGLAAAPAGDAARYEQVGRILTFALGATRPLPSFPEVPKRKPSWTDTRVATTPEQIVRGGELYYNHCAFCHGQGGVLPDLRYSAPEVHKIFDLIVRQGLYASLKGMPSFQKILTAEDVKAVQAYVLDESRKLVEGAARAERKEDRR